MKAHQDLLKQILLSAPANVRLFQNDQGTMQLIDGRWLKFGLCPGSGDLIGATQIRGLAVLTSIEGKTVNDVVKPKQKQWRDFVRAFGGISIVAYSVEECWSEHRAAIAELCMRTQRDSDFKPAPKWLNTGAPDFKPVRL